MISTRLRAHGMELRAAKVVAVLGLVAAIAAQAGCAGAPGPRFPDEPNAPRPLRSAWFTGRPLYEVHARGFSASGDLAGITAEIDRLKALGVRTLVLAPVFPTGKADGSVSPGNLYAVRDHRAIDPAAGDQADLAALVRAAHRRGMGVILDVVLPLAASDHVLMGEHPDWFTRDADGKPATRLQRWEGVCDVDTSVPAARDYLIGSLEHWLAVTGVDGFRFPLATLAPAPFWAEVASRLRAARPEIVLIVEAAAAIPGADFDACYAAGLKHAMDEARSDDFVEPLVLEDMWAAVAAIGAGIGTPTTITYLEDHFSSRTPRQYGWPGIRGYAAFLFLTPGTPQLLMGQEYGVEIAVEAVKPYTLAGLPIDGRFHDLYASLARLRADSDALCRGDLVRLDSSRDDAVLFMRTAPGETVLCAVNLSDGQPQWALPEALQGKSWREWRPGLEDTEPAALPDTIGLGPHEFRIWRGPAPARP